MAPPQIKDNPLQQMFDVYRRLKKTKTDHIANNNLIEAIEKIKRITSK